MVVYNKLGFHAAAVYPEWMVSRLKIDIMGIGFDNVTMEEALQAGLSLMDRGRPAICVTPNAEIVYEAIQDASFRALLNTADLVLPDGAGVVLGAKMLGTPLKGKVAGIDFAAALTQKLAERRKRLYLLGGKPGVAEQAAENLKQKAPGLVICGTADGYFKDERAVVEAVNAAHPDVLFVCLGAPKQERFMAAHRDELQVGLMIGLGGSLDGFAGTVKRAPQWMIRANLEWLYRLLRDPSRFGRMLRLPKFVFAVKKEKRRRRKQNG